MNDVDARLGRESDLAFLAGGGEMGERIRCFDWRRTPLGAPATWPQSLRSAISILLPSRAQIVLFWGPQLRTFYNDAYRPVLGAKHPKVLGLPVWETWSELWAGRLKALIMGVVETGDAYWAADAPFNMQRHGYTEETYFDVSYDPVRDESGSVAGVFCIVNETTARVLSARRMRTLRELGACAGDGGLSMKDACTSAARILGANPLDLPFSLIYLLDTGNAFAQLAGASGLAPGSALAPVSVDLTAQVQDGHPWPLKAVRDTGELRLVTELRCDKTALPASAWPEPVHTALVLPLRLPGQNMLMGFLVAGVSPRRELDTAYRDFYDLLAAQVATAVGSARAYEAEKQRAEALAALDQAKTAFFSNVSHEFRTPLTLMLGPVEELLSAPAPDLPPAVGSQLETVHRNGLRLLRLVNTLLDFSRIEAGRARAVYQPLDLAAYTAELASMFRAACERAGLALDIDCPPLPQQVYVDPGMWERVVLNLLSNAFKFTFQGRIEVKLRAVEDTAVLSVRDTGIGISAAEAERVFDRFHRVVSATGRTHEGSGIGLALVQELVKLHGGTVGVESQLGAGSVFSVSIPFGATHLPPEHIRSEAPVVFTSSSARPYLEEALRWLPDTSAGVDHEILDVSALNGAARASEDLETCPRILVADDNADMRQYIARLLAGRYRVEAVADGASALASARAWPPDLVLADVMMPRLDGFGLLRALRADPQLGSVPVIMLSARAGEESRVEGLDAGADDYLVKPFSARELIARVSVHLQMAQARLAASREIRQRGEQFKTLLDTAPVGVYLVDSHFRLREVNAIAARLFGEAPEKLRGRNFHELVHRLWSRSYAEEVMKLFCRTLASGERHVEPNRAEYRIDRNTTEYYEWQIERIPLPDGDFGVVCYFRDISDRERAEQALRTSEATLRAFYDNAPMCMGVVEPTPDGDILHVEDNPLSCRFFGATPGATQNRRAQAELGIDAGVVAEWLRHYRESAATGRPVRFEHRFATPDADRWLAVTVSPIGPGPEGQTRFCYVAEDVTERLLVAERLREADRRKDEFLATLAHELRNPLAPLRNGLQLLKLAGNDAGALAQARTMMERQIEQMVHLIEDLMDVSRISSGRITLRTARLDLAQVLQQAIETSMPLIDANRHRLTLDLPETPVRVDGDAIRLAQVFANLLNNAAKYTDPGGRIDVTLAADATRARVCVRDNGLGIPSAMLPRIFEMFTQGEPSTEQARGGLGIGLSLVKNLVAMHGGDVHAASEGPGRGSEFVVTLPLARAPDAPPRPVETRASVSGLRIMIVDDNRDAANSLAMVLELMGNAARIAYDGTEALSLATAFRPELILLDIGMPGMDGYETCRLLRGEPWCAKTVIVAVTGWGQSQDKLRARTAGFDHHLVKPIEPEHVLTLASRR